MHRLNRRPKNVYAFEKEGTLLFKEYWKALIDSDKRRKLKNEVVERLVATTADSTNSNQNDKE